MKRQEFLTALIKELRSIEPSELQDVLAYYNEYLDDAGPENEEAAINELGNPDEIASQIKATSAVKYIESQPKGGKKTFKSVWVVIASIFAAPIALPLAVALFAVVFSLFIVLFAFLVSFIIIGVSLGIVGVASLVISAVTLISNPLAAFFFLGAALFCCALGVLIFIPFVRLTKICATKLGLWVSRLLTKKNKGEAKPTYYYPQPVSQPTSAPASDYTNAEIQTQNTTEEEQQ